MILFSAIAKMFWVIGIERFDGVMGKQGIICFILMQKY